MKTNTLLRATLAELFGTFCLSLVITTFLLNAGSVGFSVFYAPLGIAISFGVLTYTLQDASGGQFNPAISVAMYCFRQLTITTLLFYLIAQVAGAYLGAEIARYFSGAVLLAPSGVSARADWAELIGTAIFAFAVGRVGLKKVVAGSAGLVTGGALLLALTISKVASGGILNPAVALSIGSLHPSYLLMPFIGALIGVGIASFLPPTKA